MLAYSIVMFAAAAIFIVVSVAIYKGNTNLIHEYHQTRVKDKAAYGRAFGKALSVFAAAMLLSGVMDLAAASHAAAVAVLLIGLAIGTALLIAVQRKYNQGIF